MGGNPAPEPIVLRGHGGDVQCVAFTTLGGVECLLSGDSNGDVVAWDLALRRPLWRLAAHPPSSGVLSVEAMPGGASCPPGDTSERGETSATRVLTQGRDGTLKCWRASGADAPSPDPAWSVTSGSFHFCRFASARDVSTTNLRALAVVGAETSAVDVLAVLADAADAPPAHARTFRVPTECSYEKKRSETWDASLRGAPEGKLGTVMACAFLFAPFASGEATDETSPRGGALLLVVGYEEGTVALWDCERVGDGTAAPPPLSEADERDAKPFRAAPAPARVSGAPLWRERAHGDAVTSIAADTRRGGFVSASADGGVLRFSVRAVRETIREDDSESESSTSKTNETKTKTRVSFSTRVKVRRAQAHGGAPEDAFATGAATRGVACVAVRDDGAVFAAGGWDGRTRVYEIRGDHPGSSGSGGEKKPKRKPKRLASLGFHDDVVSCAAFRTAGGGKGARAFAGWLATGSRDGAVALWPIFPPKTRADGDGDEDEDA